MANEKRLIDANDLWQKTFVCEEPGDFRKAIENAPTVGAVEVVHAEWLDGSGMSRDGSVVYESIDCSHCEEIFKIESYDREYWKNRFKVCPFCGAVMDGGNEDGS